MHFWSGIVISGMSYMPVTENAFPDLKQTYWSQETIPQIAIYTQRRLEKSERIKWAKVLISEISVK